MTAMLIYAFKIIRAIIFSSVKKKKKKFHSQANFLQQRNFSTVMETFQSQENFPQSKKFLTVKEIFHSQGHFPQSKNFLKQRSKGFFNS